MKRVFLTMLCLGLALLPGAGALADGPRIQWDRHMNLPSARSQEQCPATERSPYIAAWPSFGGSGGFSDFAVDFRADHLPRGTYLSVCNLDVNTSALEKVYASVTRDYWGVGAYCGFQRIEDGSCVAIMSVWNTYCRDKSGAVTTIRATGTWPENGPFNRCEGGDTITGEGNFVQCLVPVTWEEGKAYRALIQLHGRELALWRMDLATGAWEKLIAYDVGYDGAFISNTCCFLEDFSQSSHGALRSMVLWNIRALDHISGKWEGARRLTVSQNYDHPGSYNYGMEGNAFWAITTGVTGCCPTPPQNMQCAVPAADSAPPY